MNAGSTTRIPGLPAHRPAHNNGRMTHNAYVYGWDAEPADERPSEFAPTTGYSAFSGYHQPTGLNRRAARRQGRSGLVRIAIVFVVILGVATYAIYRCARTLHG
ncbi:MAG TPA: hypothetical protein VKI18_14675 [Albitalea sp.]|nr:hypothetical protein [Albitalea sp.]